MSVVLLLGSAVGDCCSTLSTWVLAASHLRQSLWGFTAFCIPRTFFHGMDVLADFHKNFHNFSLKKFKMMSRHWTSVTWRHNLNWTNYQCLTMSVASWVGIKGIHSVTRGCNKKNYKFIYKCCLIIWQARRLKYTDTFRMNLTTGLKEHTPQKDFQVDYKILTQCSAFLPK